jgi:hypothetical protein
MAKVLGPKDGKAGMISGIGVRFMIDGADSGAGDLVWKPRNQWHTFWNPTDEHASILELISPAGFEHFFEELLDMGGAFKADPADLADLAARYDLEMQPETVPGLLERFDLRLPEPAAA